MYSPVASSFSTTILSIKVCNLLLGGGTPNDKCTERDGTTKIPRGTLPTGDVAIV